MLTSTAGSAAMISLGSRAGISLVEVWWVRAFLGKVKVMERSWISAMLDCVVMNHTVDLIRRDAGAYDAVRLVQNLPAQPAKRCRADRGSLEGQEHCKIAPD